MSLREMTGNPTEQPSEREKKYVENQISKSHGERNVRLFEWTILWACSERHCVFSISVFGLCGLCQREYLVGQNSLMYWNKRENENTTLGLIDYLQKQAWFCKISLNKW